MVRCLRMSCSPSLARSFPSMTMFPLAGSTMRNMAMVMELLPAPVRPTMPTWKRHTVRCRYYVVNFLKNINKRHPIVRPLGRGLLWIQDLIDILPQFLQLLMQYLTTLHRVITVLYCIRVTSHERHGASNHCPFVFFSVDCSDSHQRKHGIYLPMSTEIGAIWFPRSRMK